MAILKSFEKEEPLELKNLGKLSLYPELATTIKDFQEDLREYKLIFEKTKRELKDLKNVPNPIMYFRTLLLKGNLAEMDYTLIKKMFEIYKQFDRYNADINDKLNKEIKKITGAEEEGRLTDWKALLTLQQKQIRPQQFGFPYNSTSDVIKKLSEKMTLSFESKRLKHL